jgi:hypothetical protein
MRKEKIASEIQTGRGLDIKQPDIALEGLKGRAYFDKAHVFLVQFANTGKGKSNSRASNEGGVYRDSDGGLGREYRMMYTIETERQYNAQVNSKETKRSPGEKFRRTRQKKISYRK